MAEEKPFGRPTLYKREYAPLVTEWLAEGSVLYDFAALVGVTQSTLWEWMEKNKDFSEAVKRGRNRAKALYAEKFAKEAVRDKDVQSVPYIIYARNFLGLKTKDDDDNGGATINVTVKSGARRTRGKRRN